MSPVQDNILDALCRHRCLTTDELIEQVYRGAREPDFAKESIWVAIHKINKRPGIGVRFSRYRKRGYELWFK